MSWPTAMSWSSASIQRLNGPGSRRRGQHGYHHCTTCPTCPTWCRKHFPSTSPGDAALCESEVHTVPGRPYGPITLVFQALLQSIEGIADQATPTTPRAVATMRQVAESADQDLDAIAADLGVKLTDATLYDLQCIGRAVGRSIGLMSVSVS